MTGFRLLRLLPLVVAASCASGDDAPPSAAAGSTGGTIVIATPGEPEYLMPPIALSTTARQVHDLVYQRLARIGDSLNTLGDGGFTPDLARRWTWADDSLSVTFTLDSAAHWHDGLPVRAADVAFSFALYTDPRTASNAATILANVASVTATDSLTVVARFRTRRPEAFYEVANQFFILPEHLLKEADRSRLAASPLATMPVGSGPFRVTRWVPTQLIELIADTTAGRRRTPLDRILFTIAPDPVTAFTRVVTGEADVFEAVRPDRVAEVRANPNLRLVVGPSLDYNFLGFNMRDASGRAPHPIFTDRIVRRALTMATDRRGIVANIFDSLAVQARGPFTTASSSNDPTLTPLPYAVDSANTLLDAAGWLRGTDSIRRKNGQPLTFGILTPSSSNARTRAAILLQEQFRRVGVDARVESVDFPSFIKRSANRRFDTIITQLTPDPGPSSVNEEWTSAAAAPGGNNFGNYRNASFDAQVDSALASFQPDTMRAHLARAWRILTDDAAAIWLAEPQRTMAVHKRIQTTGIRPGAWWAGLAQWSIPADQRIARDWPAAGAAR